MEFCQSGKVGTLLFIREDISYYFLLTFCKWDINWLHYNEIANLQNINILHRNWVLSSLNLPLKYHHAEHGEQYLGYRYFHLLWYPLSDYTCTCGKNEAAKVMAICLSNGLDPVMRASSFWRNYRYMVVDFMRCVEGGLWWLFAMNKTLCVPFDRQQTHFRLWLQPQRKRMHSSRMRTARLLPVSPSMHCSQGGGGCTWSRGLGCTWSGGVPGPGGVYLVPGGVPGLGGGV